MKNPDTLSVQIHPTAVVHDSAEIGERVIVGPFSVIGADVRIGDGTRIESNVVVEARTSIGRNCRVMSGAVLGGQPQDHKFAGEPTYLIIGDNNIIREFVTIHRASGEDKATVIGSDNMIMAYCHIGHNCSIGSGVTMANMVGISGHAVVEDKVVFGGIVGVHQMVRIGKLAMVGGFSKVVQDVPPFMMADGRPMKVYGLNVIGLRRNGVPPKVREGLKQAYKLLYRSNLNVSQALEIIESQIESSVELEYLLQFIRNVKFGYGGRQLDTPR